MKTRLLLVLLSSLFFLSCEKESREDSSPIETARKESLNGYVQKGPFVNGTSVLVSELNEELSQTGRVYSANVISNSGDFQLRDIELVSDFVQLRADGYYFNEVTGKTSVGQLSLYALIDIKDANEANVNVLTQLERSRVDYLVRHQKMEFGAAKTQAFAEVLNVFGFEDANNASSEKLELTTSPVLLAISCILQGGLSTGDMSELMANISADICEDGSLDDLSLGSALINNAMLLSLPQVRKNVEEKYSQLGLDVDIPDFESYVSQFINSGIYQHTFSFVTYPSEGANGTNFLSKDVVEVQFQSPYSMAAELEEGASLKIVLKGGIWYYNIANVHNWHVWPYDSENRTQTFTSIDSGRLSDLMIYPGFVDINSSEETITIEYYENASLTPTDVKEVRVVKPVIEE